MRSLGVRPVRRLLTLARKVRAVRIPGGSPASRFGALLCSFLLAAGVLGVLPGDSADAREEYSAYSDPDKAVLSYLLSDPAYVTEFRAEFGLGEEEVEAALAATRVENRVLAEEYAESEEIVEANKGLAPQEISQKIAATDYEESTDRAVAETKSAVEELLPEDRASEFEDWVDARWRQEVEEYRSEGEAATFTASSSKKLRCKVFATQYHGYTRREVALPHQRVKFTGGRTVTLKRGDRHRTRARVKETGPWNIRDDYWRPRNKRDTWRFPYPLPQCKPAAQVAFFNDYNRGRDQFRRKVLNPAGIDLTPQVARSLGLRKYQNAWVTVRFPWVRR